MNRLKVFHTPTARSKLKEIYAYSCKQWGEKTANKYMADIEKVISQAAVEHGGKKRNPEFSTRFTYSLSNRHYVFFEVKGDILIIASLFHVSMNISQRLMTEIPDIQVEINKIND